MSVSEQALLFAIIIVLVYIIIGGFIYLFLFFFDIEKLTNWLFDDEVNED